MTSLGRQLLWASFRIGVPPVAVVSIVSSWVAAEQIDSGLHERLHAAARGAEIAISVEVDRIRARAAAVAKNPALLQALAQGEQRVVLGLAEQAIDVVSVDRATVVDAKGRVLARGHLPTRDGDEWTETALDAAGRERSAVGSAGGGVGASVAVPISAPNQPASGTLIVQKTFDYATLRELQRQFGLDFSAWNGDRLQATTLRSSEHIEEAERARRALSSAPPLYEGTAHYFAEAHFTTKAPGKGTGMGLATVHGIVKQSGAHVDVETRPGHGAKFRILFPAVIDGVVHESPAPARAVPRGHETILLCEDEDGVRAVTASFLESSDYDVLIAASGREALGLAAARPDIALLLTDVGMPEMNGVELATRLRERHPSVKVLYMSGYTASVLDSRTGSGVDDELLTKPFTRAELLSHVRRTLDRPTLRTTAK